MSTQPTGFVAQIGFRAVFSFPQTDLSYGLSDRYAKSCVAVEHRDLDLEFGHLSFEVSGHKALAQKFDAIHFCFCAATAVIPG